MVEGEDMFGLLSVLGRGAFCHEPCKQSEEQVVDAWEHWMGSVGSMEKQSIVRKTCGMEIRRTGTQESSMGGKAKEWV